MTVQDFLNVVAKVRTDIPDFSLDSEIVVSNYDEGYESSCKIKSLEVETTKHGNKKKKPKRLVIWID